MTLIQKRYMLVFICLWKNSTFSNDCSLHLQHHSTICSNKLPCRTISLPLCMFGLCSLALMQNMFVWQLCKHDTSKEMRR